MVDILEKLKDAPTGFKLYSPICGECTLNYITDDNIFVTDTSCKYEWCFSPYGQYITSEGICCKECLLFPSKEVREWDNFSIKKNMFSSLLIK